MSLSDLASIGSFVSGFAVLVSLVFLYFQLRQLNHQAEQAEKNQRATYSSERMSRLRDSLLKMTEPAVGEAYRLGVAADKNMTDTQIQTFYILCLVRFYAQEDTFYQHQQGLVEDHAFNSTTKSFRVMFSLPGIRVAYRTARNLYGDEFVAFADRILQESSIVLPNLTDSMRSAFAAELALAGGEAARS